MVSSFSPRQLGEALGVSESSLKRWANDGRIEVRRTAGGHRRIPLESAVRFIRESGLPIVKPQLLGLADLNLAPVPADGAAHVLQAALQSGRGSEARAILLSSFLAGEPITSLCDGPIRSAMTEIGRLWEHGDEGIFIEHRATDICLQALNQIRGLLAPVSSNAPIAVGGAPSTDPYALPSLMAAVTLASEGWSEINLGPDTPLEVLARAAEENHASLVWLSVTTAHKSADLGRSLSSLSKRLSSPGISIVVGGQGVPARFKAPSTRTIRVRSMGELAAFARGQQQPS